MKSIENKCLLCGESELIRNSHIIPKFVFDWMKETGGTDYLRFGGTVNRRIQDGLKHHFLCDQCENLFSGWENLFSQQYFKLVTKGSYPNSSYNDWLSKFCASIVWRVGKSQEFRGVYDDLDKSDLLLVASALEHWNEFLLGQRPHPGPYELHIIPIGGFSNLKMNNLPTNWNRYTLRSTEFDLIYTESRSFIAMYAKLGPVAIFGIVKNTKQKWKGSRVSVNFGRFSVPKYILPPFLLDHFLDRARNQNNLFSTLSDKQIEKTDNEVLKNIDRMKDSDQFDAMLKDANQFGLDAIISKK